MSNSEKVVEWRRRTKRYLIAGFGGKCAICGYDKHQNALEFHHVDPSEKEFSLGQVASRSWNYVIKEMIKCVMLCSNCHKEVHAGVTQIPKEAQRFDESMSGHVAYVTLLGNTYGKKK